MCCVNRCIVSFSLEFLGERGGKGRGKKGERGGKGYIEGREGGERREGERGGRER